MEEARNPLDEMKYFILTSLLAVTVAATAQARLGWTLEQCEKQYGKHVMTRGSEYMFTVGEYNLTCYIPSDVGKVVAIQYTKGKFGMPTDKFTPSEIDDLLYKNTNGAQWDVQKQTGNDPNFGNAYTSYSVRDNAHPALYKAVRYIYAYDENATSVFISLTEPDAITPGL
jgi:hypothetical protein